MLGFFRCDDGLLSVSIEAGNDVIMLSSTSFYSVLVITRLSCSVCGLIKGLPLTGNDVIVLSPQGGTASDSCSLLLEERPRLHSSVRV